MSDVLIYPKQTGHANLVDSSADALLSTRPTDALCLTIDSLPFRRLTDDRATIFAELAPFLAGRAVSAVLAIPSAPVDFLLAHAAGELAGAPLGLWIVPEDLVTRRLAGEPTAAEAITRATAVFASTPSERNALANRFQRKVYVVPPPAANAIYPNLYRLLFDTLRSEGRITDRFFEEQFATGPDAPAQYFAPPTPAHIHHSLSEVFQFCERLKDLNWRPDFVFDIGASTGGWSGYVSEVFPDALFILCDPMFSRYGQVWTKPGMIKLEVAVSDKPDTAQFHVASDLYSSSLVTAGLNPAETMTVPITTIDAIASEHKLTGRGLIKADVQFAEHLVIQGGLKTIADNIDVMILEVTLDRVDPSAWTMLEIANWLSDLGFRVADIVGSWRQPKTGELGQLDVAFIRRGLGAGGGGG